MKMRAYRECKSKRALKAFKRNSVSFSLSNTHQSKRRKKRKTGEIKKRKNVTKMAVNELETGFIKLN